LRKGYPPVCTTVTRIAIVQGKPPRHGVFVNAPPRIEKRACQFPQLGAQRVELVAADEQHFSMEGVRLGVPLGEPRLELLIRLRHLPPGGRLAGLRFRDKFRPARLVLRFGLALFLAQLGLREDVVDDAADAPAFRLRNDDCGLRIGFSVSSFICNLAALIHSVIVNPKSAIGGPCPKA
jgi:hypothetical protein